MTNEQRIRLEGSRMGLENLFLKQRYYKNISNISFITYNIVKRHFKLTQGFIFYGYPLPTQLDLITLHYLSFTLSVF